MKIGLNGQGILMENPAGPEKYTINLFHALTKIDTENEYILYFDKKPQGEFLHYLTNQNPKVSHKVIKNKIFWTQLWLALDLIRDPVDVFFTAVHTIPIIRNPKTKFIAMIHGLEYTYSKNYHNPIQRLAIERPVKYAAKYSDKIIVPSLATKDEILKKDWGIKEEKIEIAYEGVSEIFFKRNEKEIKDVLSKYEIGNFPYLFFVSTIQPRKNVPNMVRAFSQFIGENKDMKDTKLLIAGKKGWDFEESLEAPRKYGVENNVKFLGRVPDEDLPALFSGARGHINLSFEEGFGLPLLESLACGIPSLVSNIPPYNEIGDYLPIYADPNNIENIKDGILKLMTEPYEENELKERASLFNWEMTAERVLGVFNKTIVKD